MDYPHYFTRPARLLTVFSMRGHACLACLAILLVASASCSDRPPPVEGPTLFNFHVVEEGRVYRSAQPEPHALANVIGQLGIRSILNLRGPNPQHDWYLAEQEIAESLGVNLIDVRMSAQSLPSGDILAQIQDAFETADYPMLIHCKAGADRTGAVSALYRMHVLGHDRSDAMFELSPLMLHFRWSTPCMDLLAEIYEPTPEWLEEYSRTYQDLVCVP
jgi:protein tyrosine/serine phosphatase